MIQKLHHAAYRCRDSEETRQFYEDFLGLPLTHAFEITTTATGNQARCSTHFMRLKMAAHWLFLKRLNNPSTLKYNMILTSTSHSKSQEMCCSKDLNRAAEWVLKREALPTMASLSQSISEIRTVTSLNWLLKQPRFLPTNPQPVTPSTRGKPQSWIKFKTKPTVEQSLLWRRPLIRRCLKA